MEGLVEFFKALADPNRLKIIGLLAHRPHSVEELATVLDLRPSTASHHAAKLARAGLIAAEAQGHYHVYALRLEALHDMARQLLSEQTLKDIAEEGTDAFDRKVLAAFLDDEGRLTAFPMKRKKFDVVLRHALRKFEDGGEWDEREVNRRLEPLTDDVATLRRGFIDHGYMTREPGGTRYRRVVARTDEARDRSAEREA